VSKFQWGDPEMEKRKEKKENTNKRRNEPED
jgi:hypothetical protein